LNPDKLQADIITVRLIGNEKEGSESHGEGEGV